MASIFYDVGMNQQYNPSSTSLMEHEQNSLENTVTVSMSTSQSICNESSPLFRSVTVVLFCGIASIEAYRIVVNHLSTFGTVAQEVATVYSGNNFVVLQPHWGPNPYWTSADATKLIGETCQTVYAVVNNPNTPYILGILRTSLSDSPLPIFDTAHDSNMTVLRAIISSYPELSGHIESITRFFPDNPDITDGDHSQKLIAEYWESSCSLIVMTNDKPPQNLMVGSLYNSFNPSSLAITADPSDASIPPLLQIPFVQSKLMVQRAYRLPYFTLQIIHLASAIVHLILSLSNEMKEVLEETPDSDTNSTGEDATSDLLLVAPTIARKLEEFLNTIERIMQVIFSHEGRSEEILGSIDRLYYDMCDEYPGAVAVRHSLVRFKQLISIDQEEGIAQGLQDIEWKTPSPDDMQTESVLSFEPAVGGREIDGICILSFDNGGPGAYSQLLILKEQMRRLASDLHAGEDEIYPADYFDLMGGVGFGGFSALLLGCLRLSIEEAMEELAQIGAASFTQKVDEIITPESNMARLKEAVEDMLRHYKYPLDIRLKDQRFRNGRCKVVVFAATEVTMDRCHPFRTYSHRGRSLDCTFVAAACATLAIPELFAPVSIGSSSRKKSFIGAPINSNNPTQQVLEEALLQFGDKRSVSLILSLGSGRPNAFSFELLSLYPQNTGNLLTQIMLGCEKVAKELSLQLSEFPAYIRLNVNKGVEFLEISDWDKLGDIEAHTEVYLQLPKISDGVNDASRALRQRIGSTSLGKLSKHLNVRPFGDS
ncbi:hypothetical protein M408DRAFT_296513 [Serendipita vermifera MAFF 305830]|uniref:PNPLA domain-containing protein n=1 Tax=Serendipita vermifera MAFF 305830 TaxID=933852 RepID=A0A0C2WVV9_SERVB|nr:hypothetical protein M408DRAFT_296513 [Serendipita vermifera MAFF 305830]